MQSEIRLTEAGNLPVSLRRYSASCAGKSSATSSTQTHIEPFASCRTTSYLPKQFYRCRGRWGGPGLPATSAGKGRTPAAAMVRVGEAAAAAAGACAQPRGLGLVSCPGVGLVCDG